MVPLAEFSDVEDIWRPLSPAEQTKVTARIAAASRLVRDEVPSVDARIAAGTLDPDTVKDVVVEMVERIVVPERFVRQESVTIDDGSKSRTIDGTVSAGEMFISDSQLARLRGQARGRGKVRTIALSGGRRWNC